MTNVVVIYKESSKDFVETLAKNAADAAGALRLRICILDSAHDRNRISISISGCYGQKAYKVRMEKGCTDLSIRIRSL